MCSYGHIASKSAHAALNLYDYANVKPSGATFKASQVVA